MCDRLCSSPVHKANRVQIYATSEERKQRNRQAQAAFRERRTEYIKQLEETIRVHESNLHNLQTAHRTAADECLMLRYKNSLLERILLEKGIDVHAELQAKTGSPTLGPTHMPQNMVPPPPMQRAMVNRPPRKSISHMGPKDAGMNGIQPIKMEMGGKPLSTPTSEDAGHPGFSPSDGSDMIMRHNSVSGIPRQAMPPPMHRVGSVGSAPGFYPGTSFQGHLEHLDEDFDVPRDMVDDSELESAAQFHNAFTTDAPPAMLMATSASGPPPSGPGPNQYQPMNAILDQSLDWDPFGLTASMAFPPSQFAFEQGHLR